MESIYVGAGRPQNKTEDVKNVFCKGKKEVMEDSVILQS